MKKIKNLLQISLLIISLILIKNTIAQPISNHFFGENAWMPDTIGNANACTEPPCILYGKLHKQWNPVKSSKASIVRFGGIAADKNIPTNYQYIRMIDSIRANGMEPIIQIPFSNYRYTAQQAAAIVKYINVTKARNIKYWIIGNEPDLGYSFTNASQIANYFKPFASAMKNVDASILIVGPEVAWFNYPIITGLTTVGGPDDITGKDANGHYYLDVISFHTYPFDGSQKRSDVVSKLTAANSLQDNLTYLNSRVAACNIAHSRTGVTMLKTAITEANINWQNNASDNLNGVGANSFIGGQFIAEMMGIGMKNSLDFINIWSVVEGNATATNIGFIDAVTYNKKPSFFHFKLLAENFKGNYLNGTTNQAMVKSFGSNSGKEINVLILNEDLNNQFNFTVRLNSDAISGGNSLNININAGIPNEYTDVIPSQATVLLTFNSAGTIIKRQVYSLEAHAALNLPPTLTEFITTAIVEDIKSNTSDLDLNVFPNPSIGKFTVELNKENSGKNIEIAVVNSLGQEVYRTTSNFLNGREEIELSEAVADGIYFVRVKDGENIFTKEMMLKK